MPLRLWAALLCGLLAFWLTPARAALPADLAPDSPRIALWRHLQVLPDRQDRLSPAEASEQMDRAVPITLPHANVTYGNWLPDPYWARFELRNPSPDNERWLIAYEVPTQDDVQLWRRDPTESGAAWTRVPLREQQQAASLGSGHLYPVWSIDIPAGAGMQYLMRVRGHNLVRFPVHALREEAFVQQQQALHLGLGFVFAVPLVVVLYVLTLVRVAQDRSLPLFLAMAASEMLGAAWVSGLMHELLPWVSRWNCGWIGGAGYAAMLGLSCQHAKVFMQTATTDRLSHALLSGGALFWLALLPAFACIHPDAFRLVLVTGGTVHALIMIGLALRGLRRQPGAVMVLFVSVWVVYAVSALLYVLYRVADLPVYISLMSAFVQGSLVAALLGCAVSLQIMSRRTQMQQQMEAAQNRSLLYAAAHHDLWQPLQSLGLYMQAFACAEGPQRQILLTSMGAALASVKDFMNDLQHIAGMRASQPEWETSPLTQLLEPVIDEYRHWCRSRHITLRYLPSDIQVHTDRAQLQRIVRNLLSNALRYTASGGRILVGCRRRHGKRWLLVVDTGQGMTAEQVKKCFEAFTRFGPEHLAPEGMGLGLYSVRHTAGELGLQIGMRSEVGRGTAVWVSLERDEAAVNATDRQGR